MLDQLLVGAAPGDAITQHALRLQNGLRSWGASEVYAALREEQMNEAVRHLDELTRRPNRARPLIVHASIGSWDVYNALAHELRIIMIYHNMSPPESFERYAPDVADDLLRGRWELMRLRERVVLCFADSEFNASELADIGYRDIRVIPPLPDVGRITSGVPDANFLRELRRWSGPTVVAVGQVLPHKRLDRALASLAVLQQEYIPDARLLIAGVDRFPLYSAALRVFSESVGLQGEPFLGRVTDGQLSSLFLEADVLLALSDHEGFCVPVVEAMAAGVPVVAARRAAIPETVGDAGLLVDDPDDPLAVAAVIHQALSDASLRHVVGGRGLSRAAALGAESNLQEYLECLRSSALVGA